MKFSHAAVSMAVASSLAIGVPVNDAHAVGQDLGVLSVGPPTPFQGIVPPGLFNDVFTFVLPPNGGTGYSAVNFALDLGQIGNFNVLFSSMFLVSNPDGVLFNGDETTLTSTNVTPTNTLNMTVGPTPGGPMILAIQGAANGTLGGLYNGAISISPIPEPGTYAMMLAGLGIIGLLARRRLS